MHQDQYELSQRRKSTWSLREMRFQNLKSAWICKARTLEMSFTRMSSNEIIRYVCPFKLQNKSNEKVVNSKSALLMPQQVIRISMLKPFCLGLYALFTSLIQKRRIVREYFISFFMPWASMLKVKWLFISFFIFLENRRYFMFKWRCILYFPMRR